MEYTFEWDPEKARENQRKHGVSFEHAGAVMQDPLALSIYDDSHSSGEEDRLINTFCEVSADEVVVRIISSAAGYQERTAAVRGRRRKEEYDFSGGERGKFHRPGARMNLPIYLDEDVLRYLRERAEAKGISLSDLVNDLLKRDIDLVEAVKE